MVEIQCSRCDRTEHRPLEGEPLRDDTDDEGKRPAAFAGMLVVCGDSGPAKLQEVKFEDLCGPCTRTIAALLQQIGKRIEGVSPDRKAPPAKKKGKSEEQPANGTAPHPQPVHADASKKPAAARSS
jgi:hypothetical protein